MSDRIGHVTLGALALALTVWSLPASAQTARITATVLQVTHRAGPTGQWTRSKVGTTLPAGSRVRTAKRSKCAIKFPDGSVVKMGPRGELVIHDPRAKRLQVVAGQVLAQIIAGSGAQIQGATATAAVKGTWLLYSGPTAPGEEPARAYDRLQVWMGDVTFGNDQGTQDVGDGEGAGASPDDGAETPRPSYPFEYGAGGMYPWWFGLTSGVDVNSTPGTSVGATFKNDAVTEREAGRMTDRFRGGLNLTVRGPGGVGPAVASGGLSAANALAAAGLAQLDGEGALGRRFFATRSQADAFGVFRDSGGSFGGFHARANGVWGSLYAEGGLLATTDFRGSSDSRAAELFAMERMGATDVIAGRQRYLEGPVNNSAVGALFGTLSFDGVSINHRGQGFSALAAWVNDYQEPGAIGGWLARGSKPVAGGQVGATLFAQRHNDVGWSVDATLAAVPGIADLYGEAGVDAFGDQLGTVGVYFPSLYQRSDVDLFVEYADREGVPSVLSALAYWQGAKGWWGIGGVARQGGEWSGQIGAVKRFGSLMP